jgi:hypothetical protein
MTQRIRIANSDLVTISNVCSWPRLCENPTLTRYPKLKLRHPI